MHILGTTIDNRTVERGTTLSLNLERRTFLAVPGFRLNDAHPTAQVPADIEEGSLNLLRRALEGGLVVLGSRPIQRKQVLSELRGLLQELDDAQAPKDLLPSLHRVRTGKRPIPPHTPSEVCRILLEHELIHHCRDEFVNWLSDQRDLTPGPSGVVLTERSRSDVKVHRKVDETSSRPTTKDYSRPDDSMLNELF